MGDAALNGPLTINALKFQNQNKVSKVAGQKTLYRVFTQTDPRPQFRPQTLADKFFSDPRPQTPSQRVFFRPQTPDPTSFGASEPAKL